MQPAVFGESKCGKILSEVIQGSSAKRKAALLRYGCSRGRLAGLSCSALSAHGRRPAACSMRCPHRSSSEESNEDAAEPEPAAELYGR